MTTIYDVNSQINALPEAMVDRISFKVEAHRPAREDYVKGCFMGSSPSQDDTRFFSNLEDAAEYIVKLQEINRLKDESDERYEIADWEWEVKLVYYLESLGDLEYEVSQRVEALAKEGWKEHLLVLEEKARQAKELEEQKKAQELVAAEERERQNYLRLKEKYG
jgi:hypothetical protein